MTEQKNKIDVSEIEHLLNQVQYEFVRTGATGTICSSYLGSFRIAQGYSASITLDNYSQELGEKYSKERCEYETKNKLWELMGFSLFKQLNTDLFLQD